jgi:hypothetical protein
MSAFGLLAAVFVAGCWILLGDPFGDKSLNGDGALPDGFLADGGRPPGQVCGPISLPLAGGVTSTSSDVTGAILSDGSFVLAGEFLA